MNERFTHAATVTRVDLSHEPDFTLGRIELRPSLREIAGDGWHETVDPRVMRVLVALARAKGRIVSRDDLIESCWDGVIVGEDAINKCISRLRKVAEAGGNAFSIETVPRVGYRLKVAEANSYAPVRQANTAPAPRSPISELPSPVPTESTRAYRTKWGAAFSAGTLLVLMAAGIASWFIWPKAPAGPVAFSVAVLPFVNMSGDPANEYFSDGFSEELRNDLSNDPRLRVVARTSAFAFKGKNQDVGSIARALRVRAIVEGSVREAGNRVRITAELVDANNGYRIWSATFDREVADILAVQDNVARAITAALVRRLVPDDAGARKADSVTYRMYVEGQKQIFLRDTSPPGKIDPTVYRQYLQAMQLIVNSFTSRDANLKAFALLKQVTARQPDFAQGFAALAVVAGNSAASVDPAHFNSTITLSRQAVDRALSLDPHNFQARMVRSNLELTDWNWSASTSDIRTMESENPNNIYLLDALRSYYGVMGFPGEALAAALRERVSDPLSDAIKVVLADRFDVLDRYREVIEPVRAVLAHQPDQSLALFYLCKAYAYTGQTKEAAVIRDHLRGLHLDPVSNSDSEVCDFDVALKSGDLVGARNIAEDRARGFPDRTQTASEIAQLYVLLNDFDKASDWYERAYQRRELGPMRDAYWPDGAEYRRTPRWEALARQPLFKEWQTEHDRIAAALAAHTGRDSNP